MNVIGKLESSNLKTIGCNKTSISVCMYVVLEHIIEYKLIRNQKQIIDYQFDLLTPGRSDL